MNKSINQQILEIINKLDMNLKDSRIKTESLESQIEKQIMKEYEQQFIQYKKTHSDEDLVNFLNIKRTKYLFETNKTTFKEISDFDAIKILNSNEELN